MNNFSLHQTLGKVGTIFPRFFKFNWDIFSKYQQNKIHV